MPPLPASLLAPLLLMADPSPDAGQGIETTLVHTWPGPAWLTLLVFVLAAVFVAAITLRERAGGRTVQIAIAGLRVLLIGLILFMMYGWVRLRHRTDLPDVAVVIDTSASMQRVDRDDDAKEQAALERRVKAAGLNRPTRINLAKTILLERDARMLASLQRRYHVKLYRAGGQARRLGASGEPLAEQIRSLKADEPSSRLGDDLATVLQAQRGRPTAAVIMLTDGVTTEGIALGDAALQARRSAIPLHLVGLGSEKPPRDVRVADLRVEQAAFVGDVLNFDFQIAASACAGRPVLVRLLRKGAPAPLAQRTLPLPPDGRTIAVRLSHRPAETGAFQYVVEAQPLEGESDVENNRQQRRVQVREETIRVLYVQEYPSFEFRFLKTLLSRAAKRSANEKAIELTTVLQEADAQYAQQDETAQRILPVRREELFEYDVILFGDVNPAFLSRSVMNNLADFVIQRGGGIAFLAGPRHTPLAYRDTPLAKLMPIRLGAASAPDPDQLLSQPFSVRPTPLGLVSPPLQLEETAAATREAWRGLPPLYWLLESPECKPGARVLLEHANRVGSDGRSLPVVCLQFVGAGKVLMQLTDESYRWSTTAGGRYYARYWLQSIRYLSRAKLLGANRSAEITTDRRQIRLGEPIRLRARFFDERTAPPQDDGVAIVVEHEAGRRRRVQLARTTSDRGVFEASVKDLPAGNYRAWLASPTLDGQPPSERFAVVSPPGEMAQLEMDAGELKSAAKTADGRYYTLQNVYRLTRDLPPGRQVRIESLPPRPLWNSPLLASLFLALLIGQWLLRKQVGLL